MNTQRDKIQVLARIILSRLFRKPKSTSLCEILDLDGEADEGTSLEDEEYRCFSFYEMEEYH